MDQLWHCLILDTQLYAELQEALGLQLHHRPAGAKPDEFMWRHKRLEAMGAIYSVFFSGKPLKLIPLQAKLPWSPSSKTGSDQESTIYIKNTMVILMSLQVKSTTKIHTIIQMIRHRSHNRTYYLRLVPHVDTLKPNPSGRLDPHQTVEYYNVTHGDYLYLEVNILEGC